MSVVAKFYCQSILTTVSGSEVTLGAVCRGKDNSQWAAATPAGLLKMTINNKLAVEQFTPGAEFYLTFESAPKGVEG